MSVVIFLFSSRRRHTSCALVTEFRRVLFRSSPMSKRIKNHWSILSVPPVGFELMLNGEHRYRVTAIVPYVRQDGAEVSLIEWTAPCASCGVDFAQTAAPSNFWPQTRNCPQHTDRKRQRLNSSH